MSTFHNLISHFMLKVQKLNSIFNCKMNVLTIAFTIILFGFIRSETRCPPSEDVFPCICRQNPLLLYCSGKTVFNHELKLMGEQIRESKIQFTSIYIQSTRVTHIDNSTFPEGKYNEIYISDNLDLESIDVKAFSGSVKNFTVMNNPKLNQSLFAVMRNLNILDTVKLNKNNISEIPVNAFKGDAKNINLVENSIKKIGSNAFSHLSSLETLRAEYNLIDSLDNYSMNFSTNNVSKTININLNKNLLTAKSFADDFLPELKNNYINIHFEDNLIENLPEKVFGPFLAVNGHKLHLDKNPIKCNCNMKWIINRPQSNHVYNVYCNDKKMSIFDMSPEDFVCNQTVTTQSSISVTHETTKNPTTKSK